MDFTFLLTECDSTPPYRSGVMPIDFGQYISVWLAVENTSDTRATPIFSISANDHVVDRFEYPQPIDPGETAGAGLSFVASHELIGTPSEIILRGHVTNKATAEETDFTTCAVYGLPDADSGSDGRPGGSIFGLDRRQAILLGLVGGGAGVYAYSNR